MEPVAVPSPALKHNFEILQQQFRNSLMLAQSQDTQNADQNLIWARNFYNAQLPGLPGDEATPFTILITLTEIATRIIRSGGYQYEERYKKSLEELKVSEQLSGSLDALFARVPNDFAEALGFNASLPFFRFIAGYQERLVASRIGLLQGALDREEDRYVDEVKMHLTAAAELRRLQEKPFGPFPNPYDEQFAMSMIGAMNRFADYHEKRAERLTERQQEIAFMPPQDKGIFIVHGHNHLLLNELKTMLKDDFGLDPIILVEAKDNGDTLIEKFEHYGRLCAFAFVLVTPDDWVGNKKDRYFQARPNVLFELGWFCGRYGRNRVRILKQKDTPLPSDLNGIVAIEFSEKLEEVWRKIRLDLTAAGIVAG